MASNTVHCSLGFHTTKPDILDVFAIGVRDGIFGNATLFPTPPVLQPAFQLLIDNYVNTRGAYKQGGLAQKGNFLAAKTALIDALDTYTVYVDGIADGDANTITEAGFVPTKAGTSAKPAPVQPVNVLITRGVAGELLAECPKVDNAEYYGAFLIAKNPMPASIFISDSGQVVVDEDNEPTPSPSPTPGGGGMPAFIIDMNKNRKKKFVGLQTGTVYYVYFFAANATGVSPFSDARSLMCG